MRRNIAIAQIFILIGAGLQTLQHFFIEPMENYVPLVLLLLTGFFPALIIDTFNQTWSKLAFVLCGIYIASACFYYIDYTVVKTGFFFLPVTALLLNDKRLYYISSGGSMIAYLLLSKDPISDYASFISIYILFCFLLYMVQNIVHKNMKEKEAIQQGVKAFSLAVEAKDVYTQGHSKRVALYSKILAEHGSFKSVDSEELELTALIHDIGKISTPDSILMKNGRLLPEEYEIMKKHPVDGMILAKSFGYSEKVLMGILHHHERYDGKGYPLKLKGENIPLYSRVLAVADSFDAMTSSRAYRKAMKPWDAKKEIEEQSGKMYDPHVVEVFERAYYDMLLICEEQTASLELDELGHSEARPS
jgi:putative nucleotidyltransferase with HDIG domain